jgi:WD40 repeat protein
LLFTMGGDIGLQFGPDDRLLGYGHRGSKIQLWRLANGRELRVLRGRNAGERELIGHPVVDAEGRMLVASTDDWLRLFDLMSGDDLASVRLPRSEAAHPVFFDPPRRAQSGDDQASLDGPGGWVTGGRSGLFLWPARPDSAQPEVLRVGPPERLAPDLASWVTHGASASADARVVAVPQGNCTVVFHRDHSDRRVVLGPQFDVRFSAVSPDGRWVVTGSHWEDVASTSARIWDAESGQLLHELPLVGSTVARFSPDGRWLLTGTAGMDCRLWEAGSWQEVRRFDYGVFTFSPDSSMLAIGDVFSVMRLVETATGREVARLTGPKPQWYQPACFTQDGTRLISTGSDATSLYVWDLRLIRQQLKELGLDWDWPEFATEGQGPHNALARPPPTTVRIMGAELLGDKEEGN